MDITESLYNIIIPNIKNIKKKLSIFFKILSINGVNI